MRIVLAIFLVLHGIAHLPGFAVSWKLMRAPDIPYTTRVLGGRVEIGEVGFRMMGVLWLLTAIAFCVVAARVGRPGWAAGVGGIAAVSLVLSALNLPAARIGLALNVLILGMLALGTARGWHWISG